MGLRNNPQDAIALIRARLEGDRPAVEAVTVERGLNDLVGYRETLFASTAIGAALVIMLAGCRGETPEAVLDQVQTMAVSLTDEPT